MSVSSLRNLTPCLIKDENPQIMFSAAHNVGWENVSQNDEDIFTLQAPSKAVADRAQKIAFPTNKDIVIF